MIDHEMCERKGWVFWKSVSCYCKQHAVCNCEQRVQRDSQWSLIPFLTYKTVMREEDEENSLSVMAFALVAVLPDFFLFFYHSHYFLSRSESFSSPFVRRDFAVFRKKRLFLWRYISHRSCLCNIGNSFPASPDSLRCTTRIGSHQEWVMIQTATQRGMLWGKKNRRGGDAIIIDGGWRIGCSSCKECLPIHRKDDGICYKHLFRTTGRNRTRKDISFCRMRIINKMKYQKESERRSIDFDSQTLWLVFLWLHAERAKPCHRSIPVLETFEGAVLLLWAI